MRRQRRQRHKENFKRNARNSLAPQKRVPEAGFPSEAAGGPAAPGSRRMKTLRPGLCGHPPAAPQVPTGVVRRKVWPRPRLGPPPHPAGTALKPGAILPSLLTVSQRHREAKSSARSHTAGEHRPPRPSPPCGIKPPSLPPTPGLPPVWGQAGPLLRRGPGPRG